MEALPSTQADTKKFNQSKNLVAPPFIPLRDLDQSLSRLAIETRILIFEYALANSAEGVTPAIIRALRCHPQYYHEALRAWYATSTMHVDFKNSFHAFHPFRTSFPKSSDIFALLRIVKIEHMVFA